MNHDLIEYDEGEPVQTGVYACRVPLDSGATLYQDLFLTWHESRWWHCGSDMPYRGHVPFFVGPLRRKMPRAAPSLDDLFGGSACPLCGELQFNTPSGVTCPNGHGGVEV